MVPVGSEIEDGRKAAQVTSRYVLERVIKEGEESDKPTTVKIESMSDFKTKADPGSKSDRSTSTSSSKIKPKVNLPWSHIRQALAQLQLQSQGQSQSQIRGLSAARASLVEGPVPASSSGGSESSDRVVGGGHTQYVVVLEQPQSAVLAHSQLQLQSLR